MKPSLWINPQICHTCARCRARLSCRVRAIVQLEPGELPYIEMQRCLACQACLPACPHGAIVRPDGLAGTSQNK